MEAVDSIAAACRLRRLPTGLLVLWTPPDIQRCSLRTPRTDLPVLIRTQQSVAFELPAPGKQREMDGDVLIDLWNGDGHIVAEFPVRLIGGLLRPTWDATDDDLESNEENRVELGVERLLGYHIERINEIVYPSGSRGRRPKRAEGLTIAPWPESRRTYWERDDEDGPLRLIVRIAEECAETLGRVCTSPRKALRRVRQKERFNRVQQMDDACVRWLIRQPGKTIIEKAGPRREVMCVVRLESADTPENRVVRDFVERSIRECTLYLRSNGHRRQSKRVQSVRKFRVKLIGWMRHSDLQYVPLPTGIPTPNYVLQFDDRYSVIWLWYDRLRRQQIGAEGAWRWRRRMLVEYCRLALAERLSICESHYGVRQQLFLRTDADRGWFLDPRSELGLWQVGKHEMRSSQAEFVYLLNSDELADASAAGLIHAELASSCADLVLVRVRPLERIVVSAVAIYVDYAVDTDSRNLLQKAAEALAVSFDRTNMPGQNSVAIMMGDPLLAPGMGCQISTKTTSSGRIAINVALPLSPGSDAIDLDPLLKATGIIAPLEMGAAR